MIRVQIHRYIPSRDIGPENRTPEDAVGGLGLVGRDFVPGFVDAREGEVAVLPDLAAGVAAVCLNGSVLRYIEREALAVVYCEGVFLAPKA